MVSMSLGLNDGLLSRLVVSDAVGNEERDSEAEGLAVKESDRTLLSEAEDSVDSESDVDSVNDLDPSHDKVPVDELLRESESRSLGVTLPVPSSETDREGLIEPVIVSLSVIVHSFEYVGVPESVKDI